MGILIGGGISALVVWLQMKPTSGRSDEARQAIAPEDRYTAMERVAAVYTPISFLCFAVALVNGVTEFIVLSGINACLGLFAFVLARRAARQRRT
jgi:hypothetical protein